MRNDYWDERGAPWEYDPGPPKNRSWARLFAKTPNYRALGKAVTGREEFRWHFGPMFYRGRLGDNQVKVLIVGQEGAQDESLSHRSFTGGTGGRMQNLLNHLGICRSYLFMNTFVYPIFGQYDGDNAVLAQHPESPIRIHREEIFDYVVARNDDLHLVIAVGSAAKESVASWIRSNGGTADPSKLHLAETSVIAPKLRAVGVLHPGGASKGGAVTRIRKSFIDAIKQVERWAAADQGWLPVDPDGVRAPAGDYKYTSDPIPFRDFPFGTNWRLGRKATSSNRKDRQRSIQLFAEGGRYGNDGHRLRYSHDLDGTDEGYTAAPEDLAYEPPKDRYRDYDKGPDATFARLLQGGRSGLEWPDFTHFGLAANPSLGLGSIYRGRLRRPSILVLADQQSHDDLFTGRALTGDAGQHLQAFLAAAGITRRYGILRVLPIDTLDDAGPDHPRLRLAAAATLLSPFTPMLFMGEEHAETAPFPYFIDHGDSELVEAVRVGRRSEFADVDWEGEVADPADSETYTNAVLDPSLAALDGPHRRMLDLYRRLIGVRRSHAVLTDPRAEQSVSHDRGLVVLRRTSGDVTSTLALNFSADRRDSPVDGQVVIDTSPSTPDIAPWSARLTLA